MAHIGRVGSVAVTVSISVERYLNCCHPNDKFMFKSLLLPAPIIFALLYNVPKFFEISSCTSSELIFDKPTENINGSEVIIDLENVNTSVTVSNFFDFISKISTTPPANFSNDQRNNSILDQANNATRTSENETQIIEYEFDTCIDGYQITWLRNNWWYIVVYLGWLKFVLVEFLPWIIVIILTICTTKTLKNFQVNRDRLLGTNRAQRSNDEGNI